MAGSLTDYVLRLNRDPDERRKFSSSKDSARQAMTAAGISAAHQELLLNGKSSEISQALIDEFPDPGNGMHVSMSVCHSVVRPVL